MHVALRFLLACRAPFSCWVGEGDLYAVAPGAAGLQIELPPAAPPIGRRRRSGTKGAPRIAAACAGAVGKSATIALPAGWAG